MRFSGIGKWWIIYVTSVKHLTVSKSISNLVIIDFENGRSNCCIFDNHLFDDHQDAYLVWLTQIDLKLGKPFSESNQYLGRELFSLNHDQMSAFEEGQKILGRKQIWTLHHKLNDIVKTIDEVLLLHIESASCSNFNYLESTQ